LYLALLPALWFAQAANQKPVPIANICKRTGHSVFGKSFRLPGTHETWRIFQISVQKTRCFKSGLTAESTAARLGEHEAEAKVVVPVVRVVVVPVRGTYVLGVVVPASAAFNAVRPRGRAHAVQYYGNSWNGQAADGP